MATKFHEGFTICQHKTEPKNIEMSTSIFLEISLLNKSFVVPFTDEAELSQGYRATTGSPTLLLTTNYPRHSGTHLIDLARNKG